MSVAGWRGGGLAFELVAQRLQQTVVRGKRLMVHRYVVGPIRHAMVTDGYRFAIQHLTSQPEQGRLCTDGSFDVVEDGIMTRCPSKYDGEWPSPLSRCSTVSSAGGEAL